MNVVGIFNLWIVILTCVTIVMIFCNPFFEDKRLLAFTAIPLAILLILVHIGVGWVW